MITHVDGEATSDVAAYEKQTKKVTFVAGDFVQLSVPRNGTTSQVILPADPNYLSYDDDVSLRR